MKLVLLTALGVGGATIIGSVVGFCFKKLSHRFSDIILNGRESLNLEALRIFLNECGEESK